MAGHLNIRVDYCDAQSAIITLDSSEEGGNTRMGSSLKIDVGRTANVKLPDFLMTEGEVNAVSDTEPIDQTLERQGEQIKSMQALQQNSLVPADETDHHRMQELMTALHHEREITRALSEVTSLVQNEFEKFLQEAELEQLKEVEQRHGIDSADGENGDNPDAKRSAIQAKFRDSEISEQVDLYKSVKNAIDEQQKRRAANNHAASAADLDKDAKYAGDTYRGPDSTTDLSDSSQTHDEEVEEEDEDVSEESNNPQGDEKRGYPGHHQGGGTTNNSKIEDRPVKMDDPDQDQSSATAGEDPSTGDNKEYDEDSSHVETQERADEAVEEAQKAQEQASLSAEKAQDTAEAAQNEGSSDDSSQEEDDNFRSKVNKLKVGQLSQVEEKHDLDGEGNAKARKDALKEAYDNASDDEKEELSSDVDAALEG